MLAMQRLTRGSLCASTFAAKYVALVTAMLGAIASWGNDHI